MTRRPTPTALLPLALTLALVAAGSRAAPGGHAHEHGVARLDVAVDGTSLSLMLSVPQDNLVGHERVPRNDAERRQLESAIAGLRAGDALVKPAPAAGCERVGTEVTVATLAPGAAAKAAGDHADVDADLQYRCRDIAALDAIELGLFAAWPRLQRLEVQAALPGGQWKRTLKRPERRLVLRGR